MLFADLTGVVHSLSSFKFFGLYAMDHVTLSRPDSFIFVLIFGLYLSAQIDELNVIVLE